MRKLVLSLVLLSAALPGRSFNIYGLWDVIAVSWQDDDHNLKTFIKQQGDSVSYEEFIAKSTLFTKVYFNFCDKQNVYVNNPAELGKSGKVVFTFKPQSNELIFGGVVYSLSIHNADSITITQRAFNNTVHFDMSCKRIQKVPGVEEYQSDLINPAFACHLCMLNEKMGNYDAAIASGYATRKPKTYFDSIALLQADLKPVIDLETNRLADKFNLTADYTISNLVSNWCMYSFYFGSHVEPSRRDSIFKYLYDELLYFGSGYFTADGRKYIAEVEPRTDENGRTYLLIRGEKVFIDDISAWITKELAAWDAWMAPLDKLVFELYGKNYTDFTEIEKYAFRYQCSIFRRDHPELWPQN